MKVHRTPSSFGPLLISILAHLALCAVVLLTMGGRIERTPGDGNQGGGFQSGFSIPGYEGGPDGPSDALEELSVPAPVPQPDPLPLSLPAITPQFDRSLAPIAEGSVSTVSTTALSPTRSDGRVGRNVYSKRGRAGTSGAGAMRGSAGSAGGGDTGGDKSSIVPAICLFQPAPEFPAAARTTRREGMVVVLVTINAEGRITAAVVTRSSGSPVLDAAALAAASRCRFRPASLHGQPLSSQMKIPYAFRLRS